jgi:hypothetical protein
MFDTKRFLKDHFRTPPEAAALLRSYNVEPPSEGTMQQWFTRERVPSTWLPTLLIVLEIHKGQPVSLAEYMEG